jgi:hypothetical protein
MNTLAPSVVGNPNFIVKYHKRQYLHRGISSRYCTFWVHYQSQFRVKCAHQWESILDFTHYQQNLVEPVAAPGPGP